MANYLTIQEVVNAEKWTGTNYSTIFEFLDWQVWSKIDNSASGPKFSIDNSEGGDGFLYIEIDSVMTQMSLGDYVIKNNDGTLSYALFEIFDTKYKLS